MKRKQKLRHIAKLLIDFDITYIPTLEKKVEDKFRFTEDGMSTKIPKP